MSQLIFAQAKAMCKARDKLKSKLRSSGLPDETIRQAIETEMIVRENEFGEWIEQAKRLHEIYIEKMGMDTTNWYFITVRPDEKLCTFEDLYKLTKQFVERKRMIDWTLSFEQKGTNEESLGSGFHVHIVCKTTYRSKGECLRDAKSTFSKIAADNCIDIKPSRTPEQIVTKYLTEYESDDNHKIITKEWDLKWRQQNNLSDLYRYNDGIPTRILPLAVSSPVQPMIVEWN